MFAPRTRLRVLIVDDQEDLRGMYAWCLRAAGWVVAEAEDGPTAHVLARTFGPHAIVMDLALPGVDGLHLIQGIRDEEGLRAVRILVCTGLVGPEIERRARAAGCDGFVRKPCLPEDLRLRLERLLMNRIPV